MDFLLMISKGLPGNLVDAKREGIIPKKFIFIYSFSFKNKLPYMFTKLVCNLSISFLFAKDSAIDFSLQEITELKTEQNLKYNPYDFLLPNEERNFIFC
jgi:hypothetical protein